MDPALELIRQAKALNAATAKHVYEDRNGDPVAAVIVVLGTEEAKAVLRAVERGEEETGVGK